MDGMVQTEAPRGINQLGRGLEPIMATQEVRIVKAENGFLVHVGCKLFVSQSFTEVASGLELYFQDPQKAQEKFCSKK